MSKEQKKDKDHPKETPKTKEYHNVFKWNKDKTGGTTVKEEIK